MPKTIAAVDVGTNSLHLVVARTTDGDRFEVLTREKEMVRLGSGSTDMKELAPDAIDRAVEALGRFRKIADSHGAPLRAVATSAVREAENRKDLLRRARKEADVEIEVVSGVEEARLIHLGVLQALELYDRRLLLCDIGGGSTELLIGEQGEALASVSFKLGAVRLTNRFFSASGLHPSAVDSCRRHIQGVLASFDRPVAEHGYQVAVGSSGTIEQVFRLARGLAGEEPLRTLNAAVLTRKQVETVTEELIRARADGTTADLSDLDPKRADIILAGALVLEGVVQRFGIEEMVLSEYALREGVFLDTIARQRGGSLPHLRDVALRSAVDLMQACDEDPVHSEHVSRLALELFDATADRHGLGADARALLEAGALLANVGLVISHAKHHKHSYYLIRNSDRLVGFTDQEIEVVAQIARYHRKSAPKAGHLEWAALDDDDQRTVVVGAAVLRIAIGLDRSHQQLVTGVEAHEHDEELVVSISTDAADPDLSLELYAAGERSGLLASVLDLPVRVAVAPR
ncbi:Ppx/GppA phosphatase family protein [Aquihabitans daechungensis]|uniref:Ppx/GppA phosphatase family protein n=1 Tax=Aquihabitans daechungensis TaxID=1052257 RepID=UPI003BA368D1